MVSKFQTTEEYYEIDEDEDDDPYALFVAPTYYSVDEQLVIVACLMILERQYRVMKSMTPNEILDEIDNLMESLQSDIISTATSDVGKQIQNHLYSLLSDFSIPYHGYVNMDTSMIEIMQDSLNGMINQLRDEIKVKCKMFDGNLLKDDFNILPNFKRAIQKLTDAVGSNLIWGKEKTTRNVEKFVYGEDKLYYWITANNDRVCAWCRYQESLPPRTIDELPLDHPHGHCDKMPVDYEYSNEYKILLARANYQEDIDYWKPN